MTRPKLAPNALADRLEPDLILGSNPMTTPDEDDSFARELEQARRSGDMDHFARVLSGRLRQLDKRCRATNAENERLRQAAAVIRNRPGEEDARARFAEVKRFWGHGPSVLLRCGEMTAGELRTAKAVAAAVLRDVEVLLDAPRDAARQPDAEGGAS